MKNYMKIALCASAVLLGTTQVQAAWYDSIVNMLGAAKYKIAALGVVGVAGVAGYKKIITSNELYNIDVLKTAKNYSPSDVEFNDCKYYTQIVQKDIKLLKNYVLEPLKQKNKLITNTLNITKDTGEMTYAQCQLGINIEKLQKKLRELLNILNNPYVVTFPWSKSVELDRMVIEKMESDSLCFYDDETTYTELEKREPWKESSGFMQKLSDETLKQIWHICLKIHRNIFRLNVLRVAFDSDLQIHVEAFKKLIAESGVISKVRGDDRTDLLNFIYMTINPSDRTF